MNNRNHREAKALFDAAVAHVEATREAILSKAETLGEVSILERRARQALMDLQFRTMSLDYWVKDAVIEARNRLNNLPVVEDSLRASAQSTKKKGVEKSTYKNTVKSSKAKPSGKK